jgi:Na+/H+ antiporter NhaD/arsenite permease-like protein
MNLSILILTVVLVLIATRGIGRLRIRIWQAMLGGAVAMLLSGQITPRQALAAIDVDVMLFLFGMFIIGQAMVDSGYLYCFADRALARIRTSDGLVLALLLGTALASALLMNDTLAIIATPLMLHLAREHRMAPRLLLLALAFAVTIGSVMSPIGNPQNLLIAVRGGLANPFVSFLAALGPPTLVSLLVTYGVLRWMFRREFHSVPLVHTPAELQDPPLARLARVSLLIVVLLIGLRIGLTVAQAGWNFRLSHIAVAGALPLLLFSRRRLAIVRRIDWATLIFFAAMFVLMEGVWLSGYFQRSIDALHIDITTIPAVMGVGVALSQLISNVPLVALYLPLLQHAGAGLPALLALAAGSTIAGNLLIMGAASNVIIIQNAERAGISLGFLQFARVGIPVTLLNTLIYWAYLSWWAAGRG